MRLSVVIPSLCLLAAVVLGQDVVEARQRDGRQIFSSASRFSSSGLVFPGPPAAGQSERRKATIGQQSSKAETDFTPISPPSYSRPQPQQQAQQAPRQRPDVPPEFQSRPVAVPSRPNGGNQDRNVPFSLIGKQPEEFLAVAQQRQQAAEQQRLAIQQQQQQSQQQESPASAAANRPQAKDEEHEDEMMDDYDIEEQEEVYSPPKPRVQPPPSPPPAPVQRKPEPQPQERRRQPEFQRPEQSIQQQQVVQQPRRPNYPPDYKPKPSPGNVLDDGPRRPPSKAEPEEELLEEEEEEVKPDKLQLLLMKTDFGCFDKKDGYYADENVDCEIFHYCQDRVRHSWLCPEGAIFHQVHLICMPATKENICKKSSQFHFVNDYLYKAVEDEDGNPDPSLYADRYYPEGYEPGVEFDMGEVVAPEKPTYQSSSFNNRRQQQASASPASRERHPQFAQEQQRPNRERVQQPALAGNNRRQVIEPRRPAPQQQAQQPIRSSEDEFDRRARPKPAFNIDEAEFDEE